MVIFGHSARLENVKAGEVGSWHEFDRHAKYMSQHFDLETGDIIFHYSDGSFRRAKIDLQHLVMAYTEKGELLPPGVCFK
jgi:hypothetical protein